MKLSLECMSVLVFGPPPSKRAALGKASAKDPIVTNVLVDTDTGLFFYSYNGEARYFGHRKLAELSREECETPGQSLDHEELCRVWVKDDERGRPYIESHNVILRVIRLDGNNKLSYVKETINEYERTVKTVPFEKRGDEDLRKVYVRAMNSFVHELQVIGCDYEWMHCDLSDEGNHSGEISEPSSGLHPGEQEAASAPDDFAFLDGTSDVDDRGDALSDSSFERFVHEDAEHNAKKGEVHVGSADDDFDVSEFLDNEYEEAADLMPNRFELDGTGANHRPRINYMFGGRWYSKESVETSEADLSDWTFGDVVYDKKTYHVAFPRGEHAEPFFLADGATPERIGERLSMRDMQYVVQLFRESTRDVLTVYYKLPVPTFRYLAKVHKIAVPDRRGHGKFVSAVCKRFGIVPETKTSAATPIKKPRSTKLQDAPRGGDRATRVLLGNHEIRGGPTTSAEIETARFGQVSTPQDTYSFVVYPNNKERPFFAKLEGGNVIGIRRNPDDPYLAEYLDSLNDTIMTVRGEAVRWWRTSAQRLGIRVPTTKNGIDEGMSKKINSIKTSGRPVSEILEEMRHGVAS
jgi:hypothetical protein